MTMTNPTPTTHTTRMTRLLAAVLALLAVLLMAYGTPAKANLTFEDVGVSLTNTPTERDQETFRYPELGAFSRQAGAHPDLRVSFTLPSVTGTNDGLPSSGVVESVRDVIVDLPRGLVGNPTAYPTCSLTELAAVGLPGPLCPIVSQIGSVNGVTAALGGGGLASFISPVGLYNIAHGPDVPARFGFKYQNSVVVIDAHVRPGDYAISSASVNSPQALGIKSIKVTLWGVPADKSHDLLRADPGASSGLIDRPSQAPRQPFLTSPRSCSAEPGVFTIAGDSWENPGVFDTRTVSSDPDGTPFVFEGCEKLPFDPSVDVKSLSRVADAPTGLNVDVRVPQSEDPDGLATADVRKVVMTFPDGMSVSPSSAAGLGACAPAQIGLGTNDAPSCPDSSKLGKVTIDTPLLDDPLVGDMILATQGDNPFRSLVALYLAVKGPGFYVKLPGRVDLDPGTGRLTATFDNTPQLPFSRLQVAFQGGSQAPLATPTTCGTYNTHVEITSWASDKPVGLDSPMTIDQSCDRPGFAPSFTAGTSSPLAGQDSPFRLTLTRADRMPFFSSVTTALPQGLLARISSATQCAGDAAATGSCPAGSEIGSTTTLAGPGAQPLSLKGHVYLTGPYKDAPFGLSIAVPTAGQAGPYDLGTVVVRAGIYVDRLDGQEHPRELWRPEWSDQRSDRGVPRRWLQRSRADPEAGPHPQR
jgi:hypothetical protein